MEKITNSDLTELYDELCKVRDALVAIEFAYAEQGINFPQALALPVDRFRELCDTLREMIEKEEGAQKIFDELKKRERL